MPSIIENSQRCFQIPTKRMEVYQKLGLNRNEGRLLCGLLGYGITAPLTYQQIESLNRLTKLYREWQSKGIGLGTFVRNYNNTTKGKS